MSKNKLQKFAQLVKFSNVAQFDVASDEKKLKNFLADQRPLTLELACGYGEYTLSMAEALPRGKFMGVDIQGERLYQGATLAKQSELDNVLFLRARIEDLLDYLSKQSVQSIWLTFPDPYPKRRHAKRRLTDKNFLLIYQQLLISKGLINFKTDDPALFDFSLEQLKKFGAKINLQSRDIYAQTLSVPFLYQQTRFEKKHLQAGRKIHYLQFALPTV